MCVFVLLVTHDEYEQKIELIVFSDTAAQLIVLCVSKLFLFSSFQIVFSYTLRPTVYRRADTFKYCETEFPFSFEPSPEIRGLKVPSHESCSQKKGAGEGGKLVSYCFLLKAFTQSLEMLMR